jgi:hypothetical protein
MLEWRQITYSFGVHCSMHGILVRSRTSDKISHRNIDGRQAVGPIAASIYGKCLALQSE